jgi:hypothetical protein
VYIKYRTYLDIVKGIVGFENAPVIFYNSIICYDPEIPPVIFIHTSYRVRRQTIFYGKVVHYIGLGKQCLSLQQKKQEEYRKGFKHTAI